MGLRTKLGLRRPVLVFRADSMRYTPFHRSRSGKLRDVKFVSSAEEAHVILARRPENLRRYGKTRGALAVWTHEPRFASGSRLIERVADIAKPIHMRTAHNGTIYTMPFLYGPNADVNFDERMRAFREKPRRVGIIATYRAHPAEGLRDASLDLNAPRQELAILMNKLGRCDIYGKNWPAGVHVSSEVGRQKEWRSEKEEILRGYRVNIALENTRIPNYVTEKIWDAIRWSCLPVYHGGNGVASLFPPDSYIEAASASAEELSDRILSMPEAEQEARFEFCLRTYIRLREERRWEEMIREYRARARRFVRRLPFVAPFASVLTLLYGRD